MEEWGRSIHRLGLSGWTIVCALLAVPPLGAQEVPREQRLRAAPEALLRSEDPRAYDQPDRADPPRDAGALVEETVADRGRYLAWTTHTGSAEDAVVHLRVELKDYLTGDTEVREGSGFVIRCDGFLLIPGRLVSPFMTVTTGETRRANLKDMNNIVTFAAGDREIPPPQRADHPRFYYDSRDYAVVKINDYHVKGLQMMEARHVKEGVAVRIVYARPKQGKPGQSEAVSVPATVGKPDAVRGRFAFAGAPPRVPPGAVVVDAASGLALGVVPGSAPAGHPLPAAPVFTTFADFHATSNVVGLLPDPDAREIPGPTINGLRFAVKERDGMLWVPGGPTVLPLNLTRDYAALWGKWVACTPGFWIDRQEVTIGEYREFVVATGYRPLPAGWDEREVASPRRTPELPVTGVRPEDAAAYAAWRGKRLVTPVEWVRASRGAGGAWLVEYNAALAQANAYLEQGLTAFRRAEADQARLTIAELRRQGRRAEGDIYVANEAMQRIAEERRLFLDQVIETFNRRYAFPLLVAPAGAREQDVSVWGVRDVAMNVPELLLPNRAHRAVELAGKLLTPRYDPDRMPRWAEDFLREVSRRTGVNLMAANEPSPILGGGTVQATRRLGSAVGARLSGGLLPFPAADPRLDIRSATASRVTGAGFRCAR